MRRTGTRWRALRTTGSVLVTALVLTACTANPAPVVDVPDEVSSTTTLAPEPVQEQAASVVVAVDDLGTGFNPHLLADRSAVSTAVANLVLPSVFRPSGDVRGWALDTSLAVSARVVSTAPFTVTYVLRDEAQWSDGAPVAAEDFRYLWQQMTTQPGLVDPAGYGLVDDVTSSSGGKTVTVTFTSPYPAWRELFTGLLPSHLLKDSPGGFTDALDDSLTFSASRFAVESVDRDRGEVQLQRNDRFWDAPALLDSILLRRDGTAGQLGESLRTGDAQLAVVRADAATRAQVRAIPGLRTTTVAQPTVVQVSVDTTDARLVDPEVRRGLLGLLDPDVLTTVGTGLDAANDPSTPRARAQVLAPSQAGYAATAPTALTTTQAGALLTRDGIDRSSTGFTLDGQPLTVVVGADESDLATTAVAQAAADQLVVAGIDATVSLLPSTELYGSALTAGEVDLVVGRGAVGGDLASTLASRFSCPGDPTVDPTATALPGADAGLEQGASVRSGGVSGLCDAEVDAAVRGALAGTLSPAAVAEDLEPRLWSLGAVLPLYQEEVLVAVGPDVTGVAPPGPLLAGPLADAATWTRVPR